MRTAEFIAWRRSAPPPGTNAWTIWWNAAHYGVRPGSEEYDRLVKAVHENRPLPRSYLRWHYRSYNARRGRVDYDKRQIRRLSRGRHRLPFRAWPEGRGPHPWDRSVPYVPPARQRRPGTTPATPA